MSLDRCLRVCCFPSPQITICTFLFCRAPQEGMSTQMELAHWWFCLKGRDSPSFLFCAPPSLFPLLHSLLTFFAYILPFVRAPVDLSFSLSSSLVPYTWHKVFAFFLILITFCFLLYLPADPYDAGESFSPFPRGDQDSGWEGLDNPPAGQLTVTTACAACQSRLQFRLHLAVINFWWL